MVEEDSGGTYKRVSWEVDRGRVLQSLGQLLKLTEKAAGEVREQDRTLTELKTRLDERTKDIEEHKKTIAGIRQEHNTALEKVKKDFKDELATVTEEQKTQSRLITELNTRSIIALGGGGAAGGGAIAGIIELLRHLT